MECPNCLVKMELEDEEKRGKLYVCPDCGREVLLHPFSYGPKPRIDVLNPGLVPVGCIPLNPLFEDQINEALATG